MHMELGKDVQYFAQMERRKWNFPIETLCWPRLPNLKVNRRWRKAESDVTWSGQNKLMQAEI